LFHHKLLADSKGIEENDTTPRVAMINPFKSGLAVFIVMSPLLVVSQRFIKFLQLTDDRVLKKYPLHIPGCPSRMICLKNKAVNNPLGRKWYKDFLGLPGCPHLLFTGHYL
jgi:hypothetical protein